MNTVSIVTMDGGTRYECTYCHAIWMAYRKELNNTWFNDNEPSYGYVMIQKGQGHQCPYSWWCENYEIEKGCSFD